MTGLELWINKPNPVEKFLLIMGGLACTLPPNFRLVSFSVSSSK